MNITLLKGRFSQEEALEILTHLTHVKIKYHEGKIEKSHQEEDIQMRENRIRQLQRDLYEARQVILSGSARCDLHAEIKITS